jgi:hypothetical protein
MRTSCASRATHAHVARTAAGGSSGGATEKAAVCTAFKSKSSLLKSTPSRYWIYLSRSESPDIVVVNNEGQILLARKPAEDKFRFVGGE